MGNSQAMQVGEKYPKGVDLIQEVRIGRFSVILEQDGENRKNFDKFRASGSGNLQINQ